MNLVGCFLVPLEVGWDVPQPASSSLRGPSPQDLTLLVGARFIAWHLRYPFFRWMPTGLEGFLELLGVSVLLNCARTYLNKPLCHIRPVGGTNDKYRLPPSSQTWQFQTDTSTCCTHIFMYVLFIQYTFPTNFLFFRVFFLAPNCPLQYFK